MKSLHLRLLNQLEFLTKVIFDTAIDNVTTFRDWSAWQGVPGRGTKEVGLTSKFSGFQL
jgi:hypothetical protein